MTQPMRIDELAQKPIDGLSNGEALDHIGLLIDASYDARSSAGTDRAFSLLDEIRKRDLSPDLAVLAHYFTANAWENRMRQKVQHDVRSWEQPEVQAQILELRMAVCHEGFALLHVTRQCQILTNLANQLDHIGRFIEAVEFLDRALTMNGRFAMALGNRGITLGAYARALYDGGQAGLMLMVAHDSLAAATSRDAMYDSDAQDAARSAFENCRMEILERADVEVIRKTIGLGDHSLGRGTAERAYRTWCLEHRLFINPLNDIGVHAIAACDVLTLPSLTVTEPSTQMPPIIGFFNQLKQEFVSARYLYYEGVNGDRPHYSDREVLLYNTLDYPSYSIAVEKMRTAFRIAYSLLDKIAYFLNTYLALGHKPKQVSFRSVWYEAKGAEPRPLLQHFSAYPNWPLRGLFWLSKDIFEDDFRQVTESDAQALKDVRDHLEHKYMQLHESWIGDAFSTEDAAQSQAVQFGIHLSRKDFEVRTLRVLKLVRAALIYLSLAVHREEWQRRRGQEKGLVIPMFLDTWQDSWKQ
jgi:hypothetical protein